MTYQKIITKQIPELVVMKDWDEDINRDVYVFEGSNSFEIESPLNPNDDFDDRVIKGIVSIDYFSFTEEEVDVDDIGINIELDDDSYQLNEDELYDLELNIRYGLTIRDY